MKIKGISHIAVGVRDLKAASEFFERNFGFEIVHQTRGMGLRVAFLEGGGSPLELLEDEVPGGTIGNFVDRRGEGIHHLCFEVEDIRSAMRELQGRGVRFLDKEPREGAHDALVAFVHPKDSYGVLIELAQYPGELGSDSERDASSKRGQ